MQEKIDFVILWVDGSDTDWLREKQKYDETIDVDKAINRYRDWDTLKYWFRGIEKFAPWVHKIYLVTWGHIPKFLNIANEKIEIIKHEDICDKKYLPLFNSSAIELNINKIKGLSNKFVYFNDDMFIIKKTKPSDFFKNGKPCDEYSECPITPTPNDDVFPHILLNNLCIINRRFNKKETYRKHRKLFFNMKYGKGLIRTLTQLPYEYYTGFHNPHLPQAFNKKYFDLIWEEELDSVIGTLNNRFRAKTDITQYLVRDIQMLSGDFAPRKPNIGKVFNLSNDNAKVIRHIKNQKTKVICINDTDPNLNVKQVKEKIIAAFDAILSDKSSFEI